MKKLFLLSILFLLPMGLFAQPRPQKPADAPDLSRWDPMGIHNNEPGYPPIGKFVVTENGLQYEWPALMNPAAADPEITIDLPPVWDIPEEGYKGRTIVDSELLRDILYHKTYIAQLSEEEATELIYYFAFADTKVDLVELLFDRMARTPLENEEMLAFYAMAAGSLAHNCRFRDRPNQGRKSVRAKAMQILEDGIRQKASGQQLIWPARVLLVIAAEASDEEWPCVSDEDDHRALEYRLENLIKSFNWLKDYDTDYVMRGVKKGKLWRPTNQGTMLSLFEQSNNFFASKDDDSFAKSLVTTGGAKNLIRWAETGDMEKVYELRFSNDGDTFNFTHPTPGTDGNGNYVESDNGYRHQALSLLVQALCTSYASRPYEQATQLLENFTRSYFETDSSNKFTKYLYVPLIAMRSGRELFENSTLEGWKANEQALQKELYQKIRKGYTAAVVCTTIQGLCEVVAEWGVIGELFHAVGIGAKVTVQAGGRALMRVLPIRVMLGMAATDLAVRQSVKFTKAGIGKVLARYGWKSAGKAASKTAGRVVPHVAR